MGDLSITIMEERLNEGVRMVKELAHKDNLKFNENLFIKGVEVGISLFIQKERSYSNKKV